MKILIGVNGNVDFDGALVMSDAQKKKFMEFLHNMFAVVNEERGTRSDRIGTKSFLKPWVDEELRLLADIRETNWNLQRKLGRTWMSIDIKRGHILGELLPWAHSHGLDPLGQNRAAVIDAFLKYEQSEKDKYRLLKRYKGRINKALGNINVKLGQMPRFLKYRIENNIQTKTLEVEIKKLEERRSLLEEELKKLEEPVSVDYLREKLSKRDIR